MAAKCIRCNDTKKIIGMGYVSIDCPDCCKKKEPVSDAAVDANVDAPFDDAIFVRDYQTLMDAYNKKCGYQPNYIDVKDGQINFVGNESIFKVDLKSKAQKTQKTRKAAKKRAT